MNNFFVILFSIISIMLTILILIQKKNNLETIKPIKINNIAMSINNKYSNNIMNNLIYILAISFFILSLMLNNYNINKNYHYNKWEHLNQKKNNKK